MKHRYVPISDNISIPVPLDCTPEEESALVARFKATNDLAALEAEYRELERDIRDGNMHSLEDVLRDLGVLDQETEKESA